MDSSDGPPGSTLAESLATEALPISFEDVP